jgi:hypothetical protein
VAVGIPDLCESISVLPESLSGELIGADNLEKQKPEIAFSGQMQLA